MSTTEEQRYQAECFMEQGRPLVIRYENAQSGDKSRVFLWGIDCLYPMLGHKIVYEEVGHTTGDTEYDTNWYGSREEPLPIIPIAQGDFGRVFRSKIQETMNEVMVCVRGFRPDIMTMNYKLAVIRVNMQGTSFPEPLRDASEAPYQIFPALLVVIRAPVPYGVEPGPDAKEEALGNMAESIRGRIVDKLLAVHPVCIYKTLVINVSEWHDFDPRSKTFRGFNVVQDHLISIGSVEARSAGLMDSEVSIIDLGEWKPQSWAASMITTISNLVK